MHNRAFDAHRKQVKGHLAEIAPDIQIAVTTPVGNIRNFTRQIPIASRSVQQTIDILTMGHSPAFQTVRFPGKTVESCGNLSRDHARESFTPTFQRSLLLAQGLRIQKRGVQIGKRPALVELLRPAGILRLQRNTIQRPIKIERVWNVEARNQAGIQIITIDLRERREAFADIQKRRHPRYERHPLSPSLPL